MHVVPALLIAALLAPAPATVAPAPAPATPAPARAPAAPAPATPGQAPPLLAPAPDCTALAAERIRLEAEHKAGAAAIADIALGKRPAREKRKGTGAGQVGELAAGTAASVLLPFPFGPLFNVGRAAARAAARKQQQAQEQARAAAAPEPDVEAMIRRQNEIEARLAEIGVAAC